MNGKLLPLSIFYLTGNERRAEIVFRALAGRYHHVCVPYEHGRMFSYKISDGSGTVESFFRLPKIPRYCQLLYQWGRLSLFCLSRVRRPWDVCVVEGIQFALLAPLLRAVGVFRNVVYYAQDWFPNANFIQRLDRYCYDHADRVWNLTDKIRQGRNIRWGGKIRADEITLVEPMYGPVSRDDTEYGNITNRCCYLGGIRRNVGMDIVIRALSLLKRQGIDIHCDIVGKEIDRGLLCQLRELACKEGIVDHVNFHGFVSGEKMKEILWASSCGLGIFTGGDHNYSNWTVPGRVKEYMENGIAIVISRANSLAEELVRHRCGFAVDDNPASVAEALRFFCCNQAIAKEYGKNAHKLAEEKSNPMRVFEAIEEITGVGK